MIHLPTVNTGFTFPSERKRWNPQSTKVRSPRFDRVPEGPPPTSLILIHPESTFDEQLHQILVKISWSHSFLENPRIADVLLDLMAIIQVV